MDLDQPLGSGRITPQPYRLSVSPQPDTPVASKQTQISLRGVPREAIASVVVRGSVSGLHEGKLEPYSEAIGASFIPANEFASGERVDVSLRYFTGKTPRTVDYSFWVDEKLPPYRYPKGSSSQAKPEEERFRPHSFISEPSLHPPAVKIEVDRQRSAKGRIFLTPLSLKEDEQFGPLIIDNAGQPVWFATNEGEAAVNLHVQHYEGRPVLTWWQGEFSKKVGMGRGVGIICNNRYEKIATINAGNGYLTDLHDFVIGPRNTAFVTIFAPKKWDLSPFGGPKEGVAFDSVIQEIDIKTGLIVWEWHALGHIDPADSYARLKKRKGRWEAFDPYHINSIDVAKDGSLLVSMRNTWGLYNINRETGQILWTLGGKRSTFALGKGADFAWQHDARFRNGSKSLISLFDNEADPGVLQRRSRVELISLDFKKQRASLVRDYAPKDTMLAGSQANAQLLPNGNYFAGWGALPYFMEFSPSGEVIFKGRASANVFSYRAYRAHWKGEPTYPPKLAIKSAGSQTTAYVSWNGATMVDRWRVLSGNSPTSLHPLVTAKKVGFETAIAIQHPSSRFLAVQALGRAGRVIGTSRVVQLGSMRP